MGEAKPRRISHVQWVVLEPPFLSESGAQKKLPADAACKTSVIVGIYSATRLAAVSICPTMSSNTSTDDASVSGYQSLASVHWSILPSVQTLTASMQAAWWSDRQASVKRRPDTQCGRVAAQYSA